MSKVKQFKKSGFTQKDKKISNPAKEIKIDKVESEAIQNLTIQMDQIAVAVGMLRVDFVMKEKAKIAQLSQMQGQLMANMKNLSAKYKIVGKIQTVDYEKNIVILE